MFNEVKCIIMTISLISLTNNHVCGLIETTDSCLSNQICLDNILFTSRLDKDIF